MAKIERDIKVVARSVIQGNEKRKKRIKTGHASAFDIAAAKAIAELISDEELSEDNIIPKAFDKRVGPAVAKAVAEAARKTGVARK